MMKPVWLPNTINLDGEWEKTLAKLFTIFEQDFIKTECKFEERLVQWDNRKLDRTYDEGFWHIISTTDQETLDRIPDFDRAKRLPWCAPTICHSNDAQVKCWDYLESQGNIRTYVWLELWDYVVILQKRAIKSGEIAFLVTAYGVSGSSTRKKLARKYEQRVHP